MGVDGSKSELRRQLAPRTHALQRLPMRDLSYTARFTHEQIKGMRAIDPILFMATNPATHDFMWWSILEMGEDAPDGLYTALTFLAWPACGDDADEAPATPAERLQDFKRRAALFVDPMRSIMLAIPDDATSFEVKIADWDKVEWDSLGGRATLAGDAAHAMTMCRRPMILA